MAKKFDLWSFMLTMVLLFVGGMAAQIFLPYLPLNDGWIKGIVTGVIQMIIIGLVGLLSGKFNLWTILIGAVAIFIGGILGSYAAQWINLGGIYATVAVLAIQALLLTMFGFVKGKGGFKL